MAQKVQVLLVDDLDGGEADETVTFALDGKTYEIDLTTANADKLRGLLDPYLKGGRRTGGRASGGRGKARAASGAARTPRRSAPGPRRTAGTSTTAAASPQRSARRTSRPTADHPTPATGGAIGRVSGRARGERSAVSRTRWHCVASVRTSRTRSRAVPAPPRADSAGSEDSASHPGSGGRSQTAAPVRRRAPGDAAAARPGGSPGRPGQGAPPRGRPLRPPSGRARASPTPATPAARAAPPRRPPPRAAASARPGRPPGTPAGPGRTTRAAPASRTPRRPARPGRRSGFPCAAAPAPRAPSATRARSRTTTVSAPGPSRRSRWAGGATARRGRRSEGDRVRGANHAKCNSRKSARVTLGGDESAQSMGTRRQEGACGGAGRRKVVRP